MVSTRQRKRHTGAPSRTDTAEIRAWAKAQGIEVSDRGRLSLAVIEQYDKEMANGTANALHGTP